MSNQDWQWLEVLCQDFDRARSLTVQILVRYGEWDQLVKLRCYPSDYCTTRFPRGCMSINDHIFHTIEDFRFDYQISEILRKCADLPLTNTDPEAAAKHAFWEAEYKCANTNIRLNQLISQHRGDWFLPAKRVDSRWQEVVRIWRKKIRDILGPIPSNLQPKFSSGSTFDDRRYILPQDKMSSRPTCTDEAYQVIEPFWRNTLWCSGLMSTYPNRSAPRLILGDRFVTVPKDATKHRGICVGPSMNVTYQLCVGSFIRSRLSKHGIDLTYGQSLHQRLAELASMTLDLATIDLSSASDTVASSLVELVLPGDWFDLLDALRCKYTLIDKSWRKLEKFSAMGNGYTFELETLLFYTLALTVGECLNVHLNTVKVYGDDIIVDTSIAKELVTALRFFGFIPNSRKTFIDGTPFRESCGGDYYRGHNVRSYYLERLPKEPIDFLKLANGVRRMASPDLHVHGDLYRYKRCWFRIISRLPKDIRQCRGPESYGDLCLHDERAQWNIIYRKGEKYIRTLQPCFDDSSETSYDRKFWTRDSILAAATLGLLRDQGDVHVQTVKGTWKVIPGRQKISRCEPVGYKIKNILFFNHLPNPHPAFSERLMSIIAKGKVEGFTHLCPRSTLHSYWTAWLLSNV